MPTVTLTGTGGMMPLPDRKLASCFVEHNGSAILIDCGEGTQTALAEYDCKISRIDMLLFTHVHADHISGLPGLLLSMGNSSRTRPLDIYMPKGTAHVVQKLCCICDRLPFELSVHELDLSAEGEVKCALDDPLLKIKYLPLRHSSVCVGYSFTFGRKPVFLPENAKALGVPVEMWRVLHSGQPVTLPDGRVISPDSVLGESRHAAKFTYVTDTLPFPEISRFAADSDLFVCEGMYGEPDKKNSMNQKGHMLMQDACRLAAAANVKKLWLTHYSPAEKYPANYKKELKKIFPEVTISVDGQRTEI